METEKRLIEIIECLRNCANNTDCERCSRLLYPCDEKCVDDLMASAAEELEKFANAVEVVHGRWLTLEEYAEKIGADTTGYTDGWSYCSECEQQMRTIYGWNYCPNCGAKMDGERKDNG